MNDKSSKIAAIGFALFWFLLSLGGIALFTAFIGFYVCVLVECFKAGWYLWPGFK